MPGRADQIPCLSRCLQGTDIELLELTSGPETVRLRHEGQAAAACHVHCRLCQAHHV